MLRYFSSEDLPDDITFGEFFSFRKVRLFSETSSFHARHHLHPHQQLRKEQGTDLLGYLEKKRKRHAGAKVAARLPTIASKRLRGSVLEERKQHRDEELAAYMAGMGQDQIVVKEEEVEVVDAEKVGRLKKLCADIDDVQSAHSKSRPGRRGKASVLSDRGQKRAPEPAAAEQNKEEIEALMKHDPALLNVCLKLMVVPDCLQNFSAKAALDGQKFGNQAYAASSWQGAPMTGTIYNSLGPRAWLAASC